MSKSCPELHNDKEVGPKEARVHSRRDGGLVTPHKPHFPSVIYFSTKPRGSWVRGAVVRLGSSLRLRGAQGIYTQGFSRSALVGCPIMSPQGCRQDTGAH